MDFSLEDRISIIKFYHQGKSLREIRDFFAGIYPDRQIASHERIRRVIFKFEKTGCVNGEHKNKQDPVINNETELNVLALVENNQQLSSRVIAEEAECSQTQVMHILKKHKYKSYKIQNHQEITADDMEARQIFCEIMFNQINNNRNFSKMICFTDECTFFLK